MDPVASVHPETTNVILSPAEAGRRISAGPRDYEILRRFAPQNDAQRQGFRMDTS